jgi:glycosyltransferase involved in cell wall biosynthesis
MKTIKAAILSPVAWRTPPRHYGPWEQVASNTAEGLIKLGVDVSLYATADSQTAGQLEAVIPAGWEETEGTDAKVSECLHISHLMERAGEYDLIHNHFDFLPLSYSRLIKTPMLTTIHGFSSQKIIPVYKKYNKHTHYVSISNADRSPELDYMATVYNGLDVSQFTLNTQPKDYLLFFGRIHPDKGTRESIEIAKKAGRKLIISGIVQDQAYFDEQVKPLINNDDIVYVGSSGPEKRDHLLGGASALLHPISFDEPFGLSVAEAMLCGTPVIAFKRGSMPELIEDGKTGFLCQNVEEAAGQVGKLKSIDRKHCRKSAANRFSIEKMASDYLRVYQRIVQQ